jgi:hypothetical protein
MKRGTTPSFLESAEVCFLGNEFILRFFIAIGALAQLIWDRALGLPIERPKSLSMKAIRELIAAK